MRWCARADALFDVAGMHVLAVAREPGRLVLTVESDRDLPGCQTCGVLAVGHGRREHRFHDAPCFSVPTVVLWRTGVWRCAEPTCATQTFSESHPFAGRRAKLSARAVGWAVAALGHDDTTCLGAGRHLGVDWHTLWDAVESEATTRLERPDRLFGVATLGVDEHIWRPSQRSTDRAVTAMVDPTRDEHGCLHARLLDVVPGRSGTAYAAWLRDRSAEVVAGIEQAALDPFRGYANAIRDELPDAVAVLDALPATSQSSASAPGRRRGPPPRPAHPGPPRPQGRPALPGPRPAAPRQREPRPQAGRPPRRRPGRWRPEMGGHRGLAVLPAAGR